MPIASPVRYFRPKTNEQILNAIRKESSSGYQQRIPAATKANIQDVVRKLEQNRPDWNEFSTALVNRIGQEIFRSNSWTNPLAKFKGPDLATGDTIEEVAVNFALAYTYNSDRDYLEREIFGQERPDVRAAYHKINSQKFYKITINDVTLRRAFDTPGGLSNFIQELMNVPSNSDEYDTFLEMTSLFREYFDAGGYFKVNVPDVGASNSTEAQAKAMLRVVRELADKFTIPSPHYNAAGLESVHAQRDDLELFLTPEANAALDVNALAAAFNIDSASIPSRTTIVPKEYFRIPGVQGVLTTRHFFVCADSHYEVTEQQNPVGLYRNHFLHHHQVISTSTFAPAVLLWTGAGDTITISDPDVVDVEEIVILNSEGEPVTEVERGGVYHVTGNAITDPEGGYNTAVRVEFKGLESPRSFYIPNNGTLVIAPDETGETLTVKGYATDNNAITEETTFAIEGDILNLWPNPSVTPDVPAP